jgi:hypothetical protein
MIPLCCVQPSQILTYKIVFRIIRQDIREIWLHCGIIDTAVTCIAHCTAVHRFASNFASNYLREFEAIFEKALAHVSVAQGKLFGEKNPKFEILM